MKTIFEVFKNSLSPYKHSYTGDFGIEIETESRNSYIPPALKYWNVKDDGSLRNFGKEYVLIGPLSLREIQPALEEFDQCNKNFKFIKDSVSTSVHVHVNMLQESFLTLANFITTYLLVENLLIRFSGPDRLSNLFCLPVKDAEVNLDHIQKMLVGISRLAYRSIQLDPNRVKYSALNCATLYSLGTVEIRSFRGETDTKVIYDWISIINELKIFSRSKGLDPIRIMQLYKENNEGFIDIVFPNNNRLLKQGLTNKEIDQMISSNLYYGAKIAIICKGDDWQNFGVPKPKKMTTPVYKKNLDTISMQMFARPYDELNFIEGLLVQERFQVNNPNVAAVFAEVEDI